MQRIETDWEMHKHAADITAVLHDKAFSELFTFRKTIVELFSVKSKMTEMEEGKKPQQIKKLFIARNATVPEGDIVLPLIGKVTLRTTDSLDPSPTCY